MKLEIMNKLSRSVHNVGFQFKKHSPEILVVAGVIGLVASAVLACKATTKLQDVVDDTKESVDAIKQTAEESGIEYTEEDCKKAIAVTYTKAGLELAKMYAPAIGLGILSITSVLAGNNILRKRNVALAAAYTAVDQSFKDYRSRVIERFGKELDRELKFNIKSQEVEETVIDENGKEKTVTKTVSVTDPNLYSPYSIVFQEGNTGWDPDPELTKYFLIRQQNYANELLKTKKRLFLNEVYEMLGAPVTKAGHVVGWVYDESDEPIGDNFVDFGMFDINKPKACDFINGYEKAIVLDFNVDGNVWDLM